MISAKPSVFYGEIWLGHLDSNQDSQIQSLKKCIAVDCSASHHAENGEFAWVACCNELQKNAGSYKSLETIWRQ
jgi:hypothetical protein